MFIACIDNFLQKKLFYSTAFLLLNISGALECLFSLPVHTTHNTHSMRSAVINHSHTEM